MPSKFFKPAVQLLERHGYEPGEYNVRKDATRWFRAGVPDVLLHGAILEHQFRGLRRRLEKQDGVLVSSLSIERKPMLAWAS